METMQGISREVADAIRGVATLQELRIERNQTHTLLVADVRPNIPAYCGLESLSASLLVMSSEYPDASLYGLWYGNISDLAQRQYHTLSIVSQTIIGDMAQMLYLAKHN
jgi:hypothetical protein